MKILHVDTGREMRGGQHQVRLLMNGLRSRGHECVLLSRRDASSANGGSASGSLSKLAAEDGFPVYSAELREIWQRSRDVHIIHAHDARAHSMAAMAAQRRFVVSRRVAFPVQQTFLSKLKYGRAARYLAVSRFVASELVKAGVPAERVDLVFDAVESRGPLVDWDARRPVVAPAFQNDPKKLSDLTKEACRLAGVDLLLSDDLSRDLLKASALLYLSKSEGLGSAALLAMAHGVPVIASKVGGLREVFEHDCSGLYVENHAMQVASAIRRLMEEPGLASRLRTAALARVQRDFSPAMLVNGTLRSYERTIAG